MATHAPIMGALDGARQFHLTPEQRAIAEQSIDRLIALLDAADGDLDIEQNGDELDAGDAEDEELSYIALLVATGPGCNIADPDFGIDDTNQGCTLEVFQQGEGSYVADPDDEADGRDVRRPYRDRIRRTRCRKTSEMEALHTNRHYVLRPSTGLPTVLA